MTNIVKKESKISIKKSSSKKQMQNAIKLEIEKIDEKLASLGLPPEIKYICSAITNFETTQNTVNISVCTDISWLYRALAHYENIYNNVLHNSQLMFKTGFIELKNNQNILIRDIIVDLKLRIKVITHSSMISKLTTAKNKLAPFMDEESRLYNTLKEVEQLYNSSE
jgi:hypothetical protein